VFGEAWLAVKTEPNFVSGGQWQRLRVFTLMKASLLQPLFF
jgi:hypothetical protein